MKVSCITTVYNEEKTIETFLEGLLKQTYKPNEVIIVDGGSSDATVEKIQNYSSQFSEQKINLIVKSKIGNIASGRNFAISNASGDIIVCSDIGCILDKEWIRYLVTHFNNPQIDVVAGYYKPYTNNVFEKCLATYTCVMPNKIDANNFLPSSRSIAFKKKVWSLVKGYPEYLDTCEDLVFAKNMKKNGYTFVFEKNAFVYWPQRKNIIQAFVQFFNYAKGDGMARYFRPQTPLLYIRYLLGIMLLFLGMYFSWVYILVVLSLLLYVLWAIKKNYCYVNNIKGFFWLPVLQFTADIAVLLGTTIGIIKISTTKIK